MAMSYVEGAPRGAARKAFRECQVIHFMPHGIEAVRIMGLDGVSANAACCWKMLRLARHTALFTLKPEPNPSCHTLSPRFTPCLVSMYASTYLHAFGPWTPRLAS